MTDAITATEMTGMSNGVVGTYGDALSIKRTEGS
jgi:hypothetical protein